jgi:hypothetical protein
MERQEPLILPAGWQETDRIYLRRPTLQDDDELWSDNENREEAVQMLEPQMEELRIVEDLQPDQEEDPIPDGANSPPPEEPAPEYPFGKCTICTVAPVDHCLFPCGHTNMCGDCVQSWLGEGYNTCPTCLVYIFPIRIHI